MPTRAQELSPLAPVEPSLGTAASEVATTTASAVAAPLGVRRASLTALVEALRRVRPSEGAEADARSVLKVLDEAKLRDAVDGSGRAVRVEAVAALLRLGYPWALQVEPEDLESYRAATGGGSKARWWLWAALATALAAGGGWAAWFANASLMAVPMVRSAPGATVELSVARAELGTLSNEAGLMMSVVASGKLATLPFTSVDAVKLVDATTGLELRTWTKSELRDVGSFDMPDGRGHQYRLSAPVDRGLLDEVCLVASGDLAGIGPTSVRSAPFSVGALPVATW